MTDIKIVHNDLFENLPQDWTFDSFSKHVDYQEGPGILAKDFQKTGVPLLRIKSIESPIATLDGCNYLDSNKVESKWSHFKLKKNDLLISSSASLGKVSEVKEVAEGSIAYTGIIRMRTKSKKILSIFLKYFLQSYIFKTQIQRTATGSVLNHFGPTHLQEMGIILPPLEKQKKISEILNLIDEKLSLNKKIINILEKSSEKIFKSWFISISKSNSKSIPKGWSDGLLDDLIIRSKFKIKETNLNIFSAVSEGELVLSDEYFSKRVYSKNTKNYLKVDKFDFAFNPARINIGSIGVNKFDFSGAVSPVYIVFKAKKNWHWYLEKFIKLESTKKIIKQLSSGSVRQTLSFEDFSQIKLVIPNKDLLNKYNYVHETFLKKINNYKKEIKILNIIKGTLLKNLISGELNVTHY